MKAIKPLDFDFDHANFDPANLDHYDLLVRLRGHMGLDIEFEFVSKSLSSTLDVQNPNRMSEILRKVEEMHFKLERDFVSFVRNPPLELVPLSGLNNIRCVQLEELRFSAPALLALAKSLPRTLKDLAIVKVDLLESTLEGWKHILAFGSRDDNFTLRLEGWQ
jgi:hypothetical protein